MMRKGEIKPISCGSKRESTTMKFIIYSPSIDCFWANTQHGETAWVKEHRDAVVVDQDIIEINDMASILAEEFGGAVYVRFEGDEPDFTHTMPLVLPGKGGVSDG